MENDDTQLLGTIGALIVDLYARQLALLSLLRSQPGFDENSYREALRLAQEELGRFRIVATLRSQASGQRLEEIERLLRGMIYPKQ